MSSDRRRLELGHFLRDRRGRIRPEDVGLPTGPRRRVSGLRREEVATLAGVGVTWYTMLENGTADGVSRSTLDAVARALRLSGDETAYLRALVDPSGSGTPRERPSSLLTAALVAITGAPAYIATTQWDVLAWNGAMALVWNIEPPGSAPFNIVRRMFNDPAMRAAHGNRFPAFARALVAMVRAGNARRLDDPVYQALHDDLIEDDVFAAAWDAYTVAPPGGPLRTTIDSPNVGEFTYEALTMLCHDESGHALVMQVPDAESGRRLARASDTFRRTQR